MKLPLALIFSSFLFFNSLTSIHAQIKLRDQLNTQSGYFNAPYQIQNIETLILGIVNWLLIIAGISLFIGIIYSGLQYQTAGSDKSSLDAAKNRLTNCIVGLAVVSLAYAILLIVQHFFGITLFT